MHLVITDGMHGQDSIYDQIGHGLHRKYFTDRDGALLRRLARIAIRLVIVLIGRGIDVLEKWLRLFALGFVPHVLRPHDLIGDGGIELFAQYQTIVCFVFLAF